MSNVTKILIVLLTVASIFLCGIVVTYVSVADNYKAKLNQALTEKRNTESLKQDAEKKLAEEMQKFAANEDRLNKQISQTQNEISTLKADLDNVKRQNDSLTQEASKWKALVADFSTTTDKNSLLLKNTLAKLEDVEAEKIKLQKDLDETSQGLLEKMAIIESLNAEKKRVLEDKADLEQKLNSYLYTQGKIAGTQRPVTPTISPVQMVTPPANIDLKGQITSVDMQNSMVSISIGKADGVAKGMKFYIIRGDSFICEISIIEVETEQAVGVIKLAQENPKAGDKVTSNL